MNIVPEHLLALLAVIAAVIAALTILRPRLARPAALLGMALFTIVWLAIRSALPLVSTATAPPAAWSSWAWQIGPFSWSIGLAILLLSLSALALLPSTAQRAQPLFIQLLAGAALLACWAGNFAAYVLTWFLLNALWLLVANLPPARQAGDAQPAARIPLRTQTVLALGGILFLWLAASSAATFERGPTDPEAWSTVTRSLVLLAATYQLLIFPFYLWRAHRDAATPLASLLHAAPAAAAALLLSRLESASDIGLAFALPFTLIGLLAILFGARRAWDRESTRSALPVAFIQAQSGLALLAAVWAGPEAMLDETAVLLLAGGILVLAVALPAAALRLPFQPATLIALAALAAFPLTRGFSGRSATYDGWLQEGQWLLVLVSVLLHIPLLTAGFKSFLTAVTTSGAREESFTRTFLPDRQHEPERVQLAALLLPALGLLTLAGLTQASLIAWLALLLPIAVAAFVSWRFDESVELQQTLQEAFSLPAPRRPAWLDLRRPLAAVLAAAREALSLLEGEGGLLWLFVFVVIIYLVR